MKTLLFISHSSNSTGGGEEDFLKLLEYLKGKYKIITIFPKGDNSEKIKNYSDKYLEINSRVFPFTEFSLKKYIGFIIRNYAKVFKIYSFIRKNSNIDFCYLNSSVCFLESLPLTLLKIPYLVSVKEKINPYIVRKVIFKYFYNKSKCFIVISDFLQNEIRNINNKSKIKIIHSTINENYFDKIVNNVNVKNNNNNKKKENEFIVLNIGSIQKLKGQHVVLKAINEINNNNIVKLKFIGKIIDENYYKKIKNLVKEFGLEDRVEFLGELEKENIIKEIINSDCIVVSSREEGQSLVILESLYLEKPVITTAVGIVKEVLINNFNGLIYEYGDYKELGRKIIELKNNNILYENIKSNCKRTYFNNFNFKDSYDKIEKSIKEFLE